MTDKLKNFVEIYMNQLSNMNISSQILDRNKSIIVDFLFAYEDYNRIIDKKNLI